MLCCQNAETCCLNVAISVFSPSKFDEFGPFFPKENLWRIHNAKKKKNKKKKKKKKPVWIRQKTNAASGDWNIAKSFHFRIFSF